MKTQIAKTEITYIWNEEEATLEMFVDNKEAGFLTLDEHCGTNAKIGNVEIEEEFKGKGLYRQLITNIFLLTGVESLISNCRNSESNPVWEHWTGKELDYEVECSVDLGSKGLEFMVEGVDY